MRPNKGEKMDIVYEQAFLEVLEVLKYSSQSIKEKIPEKFVAFLNENKDNNSSVQIDFTKDNWEDELKQETRVILALMYRDYIVSPEKREELIRQEHEEQLIREKELKEKYTTDNIFKNTQNEKIIENANLPAEIKKENFFIKIINFIKNIFNKRG